MIQGDLGFFFPTSSQVDINPARLCFFVEIKVACWAACPSVEVLD